MRRRCQRHWRRLLRTAVVALVVASAATLTIWPSAAALECEGVALDNGCLYTITGGDTEDPDDGYAVTNAHGVPLWDFVRERDLQAIGYPISQRWVDGPFTLQAFQKVILQWDPGKQRMNYYNTLDVLANRYPEVELPNVPPHQVLDADRGASFGAIIRNHLALLDQNPTIRERFLSEPDWLNLYGLPIRYEEREVNGHPQGLQLLRAQRTVFVIWNEPAPGTTVGRVNLQNVPDKVKQLSNVIIPDGAKALRTESDPELPGLITTLYWVADGITPLEQRVIVQLQRIHAVSETLLRHLIEHPTDHFTRNQPNERKLASFTAMADIAELPWVKDGLSQSEFDQVQQLYEQAASQPATVGIVLQVPWVIDGLSQSEFEFVRQLSSQALDSPTAVGLILQKPWVKDGVTDDESAIVGDLLSIGTPDQTIANRIIAMPFLNSIEPFDPPAVESLRRIGSANLDHLRRVAFHPAIPQGITDHHARVVAILWYVMDRDPSQLDLMFDTSRTWIEERSIVLPHTGPSIVAVIRTKRGDEQTLNHLVDAVQFSEGFIRRPFPTNYIALFVSELVDPWGGLFLGSHIAIREGYDDRSHYFNTVARRTIFHEVAHYYWHSCPGWICEGAAVYFEMQSGVLGSGAMRDLAQECRDTRVRNVTSGWNICHYFLGARLFFDLYHSLGEELFLRGLWRLYDSSQGRLSPGNCENIEIGLCHIRFAFITDAPAGAAALAEEFITRWYYGDE